MIRLGVPVNTVSKMLGHSSPVVTLTVYAHVINEMQDEAVNKLDADIQKYIDEPKSVGVKINYINIGIFSVKAKYTNIFKKYNYML